MSRIVAWAAVFWMAACIVGAFAGDTPHSDPAYQKALHLQREADPKLSPGWARSDMTVKQMCAKKWGKDQRAVTDAMKIKVYTEYGVNLSKDANGHWIFPHYTITVVKNGKKKVSVRPLYEVDHVWSRELLGADDLRNLALQSYIGDCNAHDKDRTENALHKDVCSGKITLPDARARLNNFIAEFELRWGSCKHPEQG